jgi:uncharacterized protein
MLSPKIVLPTRLYRRLGPCCLLLVMVFCWISTVQADPSAESTLQSDHILSQQILAQSQPTVALPSSQSALQAATPTMQAPLSASAANPAQPSAASTDVEMLSLPDLKSPVIDQAGVLSREQLQQLSEKILQIYQAGQAQIGLVVVSSTGQEAIFDYALRLAEQWQLGSAKHDNGLLIVVAVEDRRIQILTGYGLEGVLPDVINYQIIQNQITPYFKQGQYAQGLTAGLDEISRILQLDPDIAKQQAEVLKTQQEQAHQQQKAVSSVLQFSMAILIVAVVASLFVGRKVASIAAGAAGVVAGIVSGVGIGTSVLIGFGLFILIISSIAQLLLQLLASGAGRGGGGFGGSGGYRGGGGGFGGGGASGSW